MSLRWAGAMNENDFAVEAAAATLFQGRRYASLRA